MFAANARCTEIGSPVELHFERDAEAASDRQPYDAAVGGMHGASQFK